MGVGHAYILHHLGKLTSEALAGTGLPLVLSPLRPRSGNHSKGSSPTCCSATALRDHVGVGAVAMPWITFARLLPKVLLATDLSLTQNKLALEPNADRHSTDEGKQR